MLEVHPAGDPEEQAFAWTDFSPAQLAAQVAALGTPVSAHVVRTWLADEGLALHKIAKERAGGQSPDREEQCPRITTLKTAYQAAGNPVLSMDTKAKAHIGALYRAGRVWTQQPFRACDHDFPSGATGMVIPHGIYDLTRNRGHLNLGLSHDTSQFAGDSLRWDWNRIGQRCYPGAPSILLLCDCGGSNAAAQYLCKQDLQALLNAIGVEIRVAHYPSYCSKYNPSARRFFPHVSRACQGLLFDTLETVVHLMRKAVTTTGLKTTVNVIRRVYETGRQVTATCKASPAVVFDDWLPKWNYRAIPQPPVFYDSN